jgi:glutamate/tyrosine decarboxylase-like PLP-dependent enzyme
VRDAERLRRTFSVHAPYLRGPEDSDERDGYDYLERGPEMSRGFRALKLWMTLRHYGARGLREAFARSCGLARHLVELVRDHPDFEALHEPILYIASLRCVPNALADRQDEPQVRSAIDRLNQEIVESIQKSGHALVMSTRVHGRRAIRMSICSQRTTEADIESTLAAMAEVARQFSFSHSTKD